MPRASFSDISLLRGLYVRRASLVGAFLSDVTTLAWLASPEELPKCKNLYKNRRTRKLDVSKILFCSLQKHETNFYVVSVEEDMRGSHSFARKWISLTMCHLAASGTVALGKR
jgi:hypothetical protein